MVKEYSTSATWAIPGPLAFAIIRLTLLLIRFEHYKQSACRMVWLLLRLLTIFALSGLAFVFFEKSLIVIHCSSSWLLSFASKLTFSSFLVGPPLANEGADCSLWNHFVLAHLRLEGSHHQATIVSCLIHCISFEKFTMLIDAETIVGAGSLLERLSITDGRCVCFN